MLFTQSERDDNESRQYPGRQRSLGADNMRDLAYLKLLSREYPNIRAAASDIINLQAICGLPKGTEYFFSDLHGEHEAFIYLLRSSSGIIREKIRETFGHIISEEDEVRLANLIYYPAKNDQSDQTGERIHGGLAEDGGLPSGADLPGGFVEIHPFQGK